jgi:hemoglobin
MDISSREDIEKLVNTFYSKVIKDESIGFIFNDIMKVDWNKHLPVMYDFWENLLLDKPGYYGNTMGVHFEVNRKIKLEPEYFEIWLSLFFSTVDELFQGTIAENAKKKAKSIADLMSWKMNNEKNGLNISKPK